MESNIYGALIRRKPDAVYSILSRVSFGLPQNVMVISGDKDHQFVSIIIATKDIAAGGEIMMDFTFDWLRGRPPGVPSLSLSLMLQQGWSVKLNGRDKWPQKATGKGELSRDEKEQIFMGMYSNGLVGKQSGTEYLNSLPGCRGLTDMNCKRKQEVEDFVISGDIWKMVSGEMDPPSWAGEIADQPMWFI